MSDERKNPPSSLNSDDLVVSADSQYTSPSERELIPHPTTTDRVISSRSESTGEPTMSGTATELSPNAIQLTAEIFASGTIPAGTMLGHYVIRNYIGGGGMGRVYLATDTALDRNVAVKVLPRQRANDRSTVARFMNEARSAARLNHEHIAQVYFAGEQDGIPYIVFEYVEGTNIRALVDDFDAFPLPQALNYLIQIAHALSHAAEHGVVHRDVKPSNILITREGRAKLIDMGLARLLDPSQSRDDLTASGVTLGTFDYISPEQARDPRNADIRSDIYSLGCTFFFMLAGRPPFPEGTVLQKLLQHQGDEPPDIRSFQPNTPTEVAQLMQKMMAKDPKQRFQTPAALIDALVQVAKMIGLHPTGPGKLIWVMTQPSKTSQLLKHVPWITAVLLLMAVYLPLSLYWGQLGKNFETPVMPVVEYVTPIPELPNVSKTEGGGLTERSVATPTDRGVPPQLTLVAFSPDRVGKKWGLSVFSDDRTEIDSKRISAEWSGSRENRQYFGLSPSVIESFWPSLESVSGSMTFFDLFLNSSPGGRLPASVDSATTESSPSAVYCVDPTGETKGSYPTLAAALADADAGTTIRLKWSGPMRIDPMALTGRKLLFVAEEFYRPMLVFEPSDTSVLSSNSRSMITARSCDLEFRDVALEMSIRQDDMGLRWTLFELIGANKLRFVRSVLTIRNAASDNSAYHQEVAFFRNNMLPSEFEPIPLTSSTDWTPPPVNATESTGELSVDLTNREPRTKESSPRTTSFENAERLEIRFLNSMMRGEATGLRCDVVQDVEFQAENSLIALAKSFIRAEDSRKASRPEQSVKVLFDRVTFFSKQGFIRQYRNSFETEPMRLEVDARSSVFFLNNVPLSDFRGARLKQDAFDSVKWTGRSNFFQSVSLGWKFRPAPSATEGGVTYEMPLSEWKESADPDAESNPNTETKIDQLIFEEIRKPANQLLPRDLLPRYSPDATVVPSQPLPGVSEKELVSPASAWTRSD